MKERGNSFLRWCDRYVGVGCLFFLSFFKLKRESPRKVHSVAFLKTAGIGDTLLLSCVIQDFQKAYPQARITLFTGFSNREAALFFPNLEVIPLPMTRPLKALSILRKARFDIWIDCDPWPRINALFSFFSRSSFTIGFRTKGQYRHYLFDCAIAHSFACHEQENYRKLVRPLGVESASRPFIKMASPKKACKVALHLFSGGSRSYLKEWPIENWKRVVFFLLESGLEVVLTGSAKDWHKLQHLVLNKKITNLGGRLSLKQTAEVLKTCLCVVSVDTGIMHLAALLDVPLIALHGPTSPKRWGGIGKKVISLTPDLDYTPCIQLGFESKCKIGACMKAISVEQVIEAISSILKKETHDENTDFRRRQRNTSLALIKEEVP